MKVRTVLTAAVLVTLSLGPVSTRAQVFRVEGLPGELALSSDSPVHCRQSLHVLDSLDYQVRRLEEYDADGRLVRRTSYGYVNFDGKSFPTGDTLEVFSGSGRDVFASGVRYSADSLYHYPMELSHRRGDGPLVKVTYTYPFCAPDAYGPVADSLLRRDMPDAVLSVAHWKDGARVDSVSVLYGSFPVEGAPDPEMRHRSVMRAHFLCASTPGFSVDPAGNCFLFDTAGFFLSRVRSNRDSCSVVLLRPLGTEPLVARFADQVRDPLLVDYSMRVQEVGQESISSSLGQVGAFLPENHGFFRGCGFLLHQSDYGGLLDFAANGRHDIFSNVFYITKSSREGTVAHNMFNFGNFLWGATAREVGVPLCIARLGSHYNNFFLSPDTKGSFDSSDDLFSISAGYHWR
ncbi:MAG: hypothetical protein K6E37_10030 [Bacteroidales bacterium]|nr:hypothetical protein [Bacteroidales bacterium]